MQPTLLLVPGVGLAFADQSGELIGGAYAVDDCTESVRLIAATFSQVLFRGSIAPFEKRVKTGLYDELVEQLVSDWIEFGGDIHGLKNNNNAPATLRHIIDDKKRITSGHASSIDWRQVRKDLQLLGINIHKRPSSKVKNLPFLRPISFLSVYESTDKAGKVVSEGKGRSITAAYKSVLGEAVERITAQHAMSDRIVVMSSRDLQKSGKIAPIFCAQGQDLYSEDLVIDWVPAQQLNGLHGFLPAELVYYPYDPILPIRAFSAQHTAGLASAGSIKDAVAKGVLELLETDAYWTSMRLHTICAKIEGLKERSDLIGKLTRMLEAQGIRVHAGLINFHWPIPIIHVVLEAEGDRLPALSHGLGASANCVSAIEHALIEAIQVHSGLQEVAAEYWPKICLNPNKTTEAAIAWSAPANKHRVVPMFERAPIVHVNAITAKAGINNDKDLEIWLYNNGYKVWFAELGVFSGLVTVRVFSEDFISPFSERSLPSHLLLNRGKMHNCNHLCFNPILT